MFFRDNSIVNARLLKDDRDDWRAVGKVTVEEQRQSSISVHWQQLNALLTLARDLVLSPAGKRSELEVVRERWARLKDRL